jgi:hypothetical protein
VAAAIEHNPSFWRICQPLCGMVATVEDGRIPLRRTTTGFEPVSSS